MMTRLRINVVIGNDEDEKGERGGKGEKVNSLAMEPRRDGNTRWLQELQPVVVVKPGEFVAAGRCAVSAPPRPRILGASN
jgi:hypothetical protein